MFRLSLCQKSCCPIVSITKGRIMIQDDYGGQVLLTQEELKLLVDKYGQIQEVLEKKNHQES
ncbi:hypothetical protein [Heliorestis convoluta]|nr:hypothetical protein [Heliorestis convoluta]